MNDDVGIDAQCEKGKQEILLRRYIVCGSDICKAVRFAVVAT